jgi:hypothetical protein
VTVVLTGMLIGTTILAAFPEWALLSAFLYGLVPSSTNVDSATGARIRSRGCEVRTDEYQGTPLYQTTVRAMAKVFGRLPSRAP